VDYFGNSSISVGFQSWSVSKEIISYRPLRVSFLVLCINAAKRADFLCDVDGYGSVGWLPKGKAAF
jgi:hypothetical protein